MQLPRWKPQAMLTRLYGLGTGGFGVPLKATYKGSFKGSIGFRV